MTYTIHRDCRHFRGHIPCRPHKQQGVVCENCGYYEPFKERILIIKLAAVGDVIRTTVLLRKLRKEFPQCWISWLTETPVVVPTRAFDKDGVDEVLKWGHDATLIASSTPWDWVIVLDKDREVCALANRLKTKKLSGYLLKDGLPAPADELATDKFITGIDDFKNRENTLSYPQEIFRICGYEWQGEEYLFDPRLDQSLPEGVPARQPVIGLNTGCAPRWKTRLWPFEYWEELTYLLSQKGYAVLLLGGPDEDERNTALASEGNAAYLGYFPLPQFIRLMGECDVVVSAVTMAMHIAIGLQKRLVLFNNIFNPKEFELYGRGEIIEPHPPCECTFPISCDKNCMSRITPDIVLAAVERQAAAFR